MLYAKLLVVQIDNTTHSTLKFEDLVASLLSKEIRRKCIYGMVKDVLFIRYHSQEREKMYLGSKSKFVGRYKCPK